MVANALTDQTTSTTAFSPTPSLDQTRTSADALAGEVGLLRSQARFLGEDAANLHNGLLSRQLEARTNELRKQSPRDLLTVLAEHGFAWRDIARIVGVSVPALRKWREGGGVSGDHALAIARLAAFCAIAQDDHLVLQEVAGWLEQPIVSGAGITGIDLVAEHRYEELLEYASGHVNPEGLLDRLRPEWRQKLGDHAEVFISPDGMPGIRLGS